MLSIPHMIVLFVVVLVVFGPQKLPELARGLGKLMAEFRKASLDFRGAFEEEMRELERQALLTERKKAAEAVAAPTAPAEPAPETVAGAETSSGEADAGKPGPSETAAISPLAETVPRSAEPSPAEKDQEAPASASVPEAHHDTHHPV